MLQSKAEKLARLTRYATRYEVVASNNDVLILIGYTSRRSFPGLLAMLRRNSEAFVAVTGSESIRKESAKLISTDTDWHVKFSGRTQRESICQGEHPFVVDLVEKGTD